MRKEFFPVTCLEQLSERLIGRKFVVSRNFLFLVLNEALAFPSEGSMMRLKL